MLIGVISDTHGLLRPQAVEALRGSQLILHAGDIGKAEVLDGLAKLAPVRAVRGNIDRGKWADSLPETETVLAGGKKLYLLHDPAGLASNPPPAGVAAVITGHTHRPAHHNSGGILFFNPGSAGPRRFRLPVCIGKLEIRQGELCPEILVLTL